MNILVIGELCVDRFVYGKITRLCPEAPVPVFNPLQTIENPGMAGNVVENIITILKTCNITFWHQEEKIIKQRIVDAKSNHMIVRIDEGENEKIKTIVIDAKKKKLLKEANIVIVSDYNKGFLNDEDLWIIGNLSNFSVIDTKRKISEKICNSYTFVKFNEVESFQNSSVSNNPNVIVTLGKQGAKVGEKIYLQESPRETIDVSGAGDTFVAAFSLKYYETKDLEKSINFANLLAGQVVSMRGVVTPQNIF